MLSKGVYREYLTRLGPPQYFKRLQEVMDGTRVVSSSGLPEIKKLSPRQGQEFLNYLGSRLRTAAKKFHTTKFVSEEARVAFEKKMELEFDNALKLLGILSGTGKHFVAPKYMTHCIEIEGDQAYKIGTGFDIEDGVTVLLSDSNDDWWVNGKTPPSDLHSLLRSWRLFQSFSKISFLDIENVSDEILEHQYQLVSMTSGAMYATYLRYKGEMLAVENEIQELEIALGEAEDDELELFQNRHI